MRGSAVRLLRGPVRRLGRTGLALGTAGGGLGLYLSGSTDEYRSISEAQLPLTYDPAAIADVWREHPRCVLARLVEVGRVAIPFVSRVCAMEVAARLQRPSSERLNGSELEETRAMSPSASHARLAAELRELFTQLGPTFIKFGQMLSIRPDLLPPAAVYELQKLCDAVPSYPTREALALISAEIGAPATEMFDELDESSLPIAAASLGQVYKCRARATGEVVALKVQRPDMIRAVSLDLYLLRKYMQGVEWFKEQILTGIFGAAERSAFDVALLDTFARASYLELDYAAEAANQRRFELELVPLMRGKVYVPKTLMATRKLLVTEWIEGQQLAKSSREVINALTPVGVDCFLHQLLVLGFFHSDPHPGNILVDAQGRLVLIDFGLCAKIDRFDSQALTSAIVNLMRGDVEALVEDAIALRFLPSEVDRATLLPPLRTVFARAQLAANFELHRLEHDEEVLLAEDRGTSPPSAKQNAASMASLSEDCAHGAVQRRRRQFASVSRELNQIFFEFPFSVPEYFALITRALIVLEGIALTGDPNFDLFRSAYPYAVRHAAALFGKRQLAQMMGEATIVGAVTSSHSNSVPATGVEHTAATTSTTTISHSKENSRPAVSERRLEWLQRQ